MKRRILKLGPKKYFANNAIMLPRKIFFREIDFTEKILELIKFVDVFLQREIRKIHDEIKEDYLFAVKKSIVDFVLKEPEIDEDERFLDEDDETPLTIELGK